MEAKECSEFQMRKESFQHACLGSYLIIPLRYGSGGVDGCRNWLQGHALSQTLTTSDLNESTKDAVQGGQQPILKWYRIPNKLFKEKLRDFTHLDVPECLYVRSKGCTEPFTEQDSFSLNSIELYSFPQVAFFCLGIQYVNIQQLEIIVNPGYKDCCCEYYCSDKKGRLCEFSLDELILSMCRDAGTDAFYKRGSSLFLEAYTFSLAMVPERFESLDTLRQASYNLHLMAPLHMSYPDEAEEDIRYVFAVKDVTLQTYRWGCCASLQSVCVVTANDQMDVDGEMEARVADDLPPILLTLYQKYTCLRFAELLSQTHGSDIRKLRRLHQAMLEFKAYGVIYPTHISRWNNVRQIYAHLFSINGVDAAITDIDNKISILVERQKEKKADIESAIAWIITLFGILSIIQSVMSIISLLRGGTPTEHVTLLIISLTLMLIFSISVLFQRAKWQ